MRGHVSAALRKSAGVLLVALSAAMLFSLFTYSPTDPSPSTASAFPVRNLGGVAGAMFWGFMLQYFGLASVIAVCAAYSAGRSLLSPSYMKRPLSTALLSSVMGMLFASMALAYVSAVALGEWPTPAGLGGLFGYVARADVARFVAERGVTRWLHAVVFVLLLLATMTSLYFALGMTQESILRFENSVARMYYRIMRRERSGPRSQSRIVEAFRRLAPKRKARPRPQSRKAEDRAARPTASRSRYALPTLGLLDPPRADRGFGNNDELNEKKARMLENILTEFGVVGRITNIKTGPVITLFELEPGRGTKTSRITALAEDIARDMSALSARVAVIPGTNKIGVELPNARRRTVYIREQLDSPAFSKHDMILPISLGADTGGRAIFVDLARMPHLLIAGTTGSGKSVGVNGMLLSLMYKYRPDEVKFIMIDPKMLEFSVYADIPHLLIPVVTDPVKAVAALKWAVREMEERNKNMSALGAKNIESYNAKAADMEG
ncbi:MAG: DNA translocase FtsK 4TM domain-containing protein, partial [Rickettsiales bacterium]|nr:DNA translocase FtsK 4TM domain-containing protein [Rickettsiales bacterium]